MRCDPDAFEPRLPMCDLGATGVKRYSRNDSQREVLDLYVISKETHFCSANATGKASLTWLAYAIAARSA